MANRRSCSAAFDHSGEIMTDQGLSLRECPISGHLVNPASEIMVIATNGRPGYWVKCPFCGEFLICSLAVFRLPQSIGDPNSSSEMKRVAQRRKAVLAYAIRKMGSMHDIPLLTLEQIRHFLEEDRLPNFSEQSDNFLRWLNENTDLGTYWNVSYQDVGAIIGSKSESEFQALVRGMIRKGLLEEEDSNAVCVTYDGILRLEELSRAAPSGNNAFLAMKYGESVLENLVREHLKPAVEQTGFSLYRLDDRPQAGLIDARLRNEIRNSRFLLVDLSHANAGAYWEAGYAEGLGKPVIYLCERSVFDGKSDIPRPHFDTNHHTTVIWEAENPVKAANDLKETIRFTLPEAPQREN
jgi:hypothetical protein